MAVEVFLSNGWRKPYCYTIVDMHKVVKGPIDDPEGIMDGGWYIHKNKIIDKDKHFKWLLQSNFKFIMGFDYMPYNDREKYINLMIENNKPIYPIVKSLDDWKWFIKNGWLNKVEGISTAVDEVIDIAHKHNLNIHHLGRIKNKENFKKITSIDLNPYETKKDLLLNLGSERILKLPKSILSLGEFIIYGSSLYVANPNDIDLLYYGPHSEKYIKQQLIDVGFNNVNALKYTKEKHVTGKITHLLFAHDHGIQLTPCPTLEKMYSDYKGLTLKQLYYKLYLCSNYYKDSMYDKELKTLLVTYQYYRNNELSNFLWNKLHVIYKIVGDKDKKAEMLFNRLLFKKFGRMIVLPLTERKQLYEHKKLDVVIDLFFPKVDSIIDPEQITLSEQELNKLFEREKINKVELHNEIKKTHVANAILERI